MNTPQRLQVRLTCQAQTDQSGVILPAGTIGTVLDYQRGVGNESDFMLVNFGLKMAVKVPLTSPLIEIMTGGEQ